MPLSLKHTSKRVNTYKVSMTKLLFNKLRENIRRKIRATKVDAKCKVIHS